MRRVLFVAHNHPTTRPGGMETYAEELCTGMREAGRFAPTFLSRVGPPHTLDMPHDGTRLMLAEGRPDLYYLYTRGDEFDRVLWTSRRARPHGEDWRRFLMAQRPDVVHFHHTLFLGYDLIRETRRALPDAAIVYTLHEFVPICHHNGQMVRTESLELCDRATPRRCHQCFPNISAQTFFLRERFAKAAFGAVDAFVAPSEQLRSRYIEWGIAPDKLRYEDNGRLPAARLADPPGAGRRRRIGFFGQISRFKGVDVLLEAMKLLGEREVDVVLVLHGANLTSAPPAFQERIAMLLREASETVRFEGPYEHRTVPGLMSDVDWVIVPSIWWENAPLVIQEAMMHRRPVICSDIGGMAEKITPQRNGLHFRVGDPRSLADTIQHAIEHPELWDHLRAQITDPHPMSQHVETLSNLYDELLARRRDAIPDG